MQITPVLYEIRKLFHCKKNNNYPHVKRKIEQLHPSREFM